MVPSPPSPRSSRTVWLAIALLHAALLVFFALRFSFVEDGVRTWTVSDDVYIMGCYGRNIAEGNGAVWYAGATPVEGFTNPLWTLMIAGIHLLPGYTEERLGLFLLLVQLAFLALVGVLCWKVFERLRALAVVRAEESGGRAWVLLPLSCSWASLTIWQTEGFETAMLAGIGLLALLVALRRPLSDIDALTIGLLAGLATWTRLDGMLICVPAVWVLVRERGLRPAPLFHAALGCGLPVVLLIAGRYLVFGQWLPNTYYTKLTGWSLADQLARGLESDWPMLPTLVLAWAFFLARRVRERLGGALRPIIGLMLGATVLLAYSVRNGGDWSTLRLGSDRFTAPGALFLGLSLGLALLRMRALLLAPILALALLPLALDPGLGYLVKLGTGEYRRPEHGFARFGRALRACSLPEAKVALSAAGAIVYFSHRGAIDALGKCDPEIARLPVNFPSSTPGHNKRYFDLVFRRDRPEFAHKAPPPEFRSDYVRCSFQDQQLWVRRDTTHARWDLLQKLEHP